MTQIQPNDSIGWVKWTVGWLDTFNGYSIQFIQLIQLELPLIFLTRLCIDFPNFSDRQRVIIAGTALPILFSHFYMISSPQKIHQTYNPNSDDGDVVSSVYAENLRTLAQQVEVFDKHGPPSDDTSPSIGLSSIRVQEQRERCGFNETWKGWTVLGCLAFFLLRELLDTASLLSWGLSLLAYYLGYTLYSTGLICLLVLRLSYAQGSQALWFEVLQSMAGDPNMTQKTFRDGKLTEIPFRELVPGDVIRIQKGDVLGADASLIYMSAEFSMNESTLQGGSKSITKNHGDICYFSTTCVGGHGYLFVDNIGYKTIVGQRVLRIYSAKTDASILSATQSNTAFEEFKNVIRNIGSVSAVTAIILLMVTTWRLQTPQSQTFDNGISIAFSLMICILPICLNPLLLELRQDVLPILKSNDIFFPSFLLGDTGPELLAGIDTIIVDHTGTITKHEYQMMDPVCINCEIEDILLCAALSIAGKQVSLDAVDECMLKALHRNLKAESRWIDWTIITHGMPARDSRVYGSVVENSSGETMVCVKGSPRAILEICQVSEQDTEIYKTHCTDLAQCGCRCLAAAWKRETQQSYQLLGILPMMNFPRDDTHAAIIKARDLGITVKILTGDTAIIAQKFAKLIGIEGNAVSTEILDNQDSSDMVETRQRIEDAAIYSEIQPRHRKPIVNILQDAGRRVAITGKNSSDASALKCANIGIAVPGSAVLVQYAADISPTQDGIGTIVRGIEISRTQSMKLWTVVSCTALFVLHNLWFEALFIIITGKVLHPLETLFQTLTGHFVVYGLAYRNIPMSRNQFKEPLCWSARRFWGNILLILILLIFGTAMSIGVIRFFAVSAISPPTSPSMSTSVLDATSGLMSSQRSLFGLTMNTVPVDTEVGMCVLARDTALDPRSEQSYRAVIFHIISRMKMIGTVMGYDWSTCSFFGSRGQMWIAGHGVVILMSMVFVDWMTVACLSLIDLWVLLTTVTVRRLQMEDDEEGGDGSGNVRKDR